MSDKVRAAFHGARTLPAAAVPVGAVVNFYIAESLRDRHVTVTARHNSDPVPGKIRWETAEVGDLPIGAATDVEIVSLP